MTIFDVNATTKIVCGRKKTRTAFKHEAVLFVNGREINSVKISYQNRTWERFEFESVVNKLLDITKVLNDSERKEFMHRISGHSTTFQSVAMIAQLGEVFGKSQKEKNDWKERMLKAGLKNKGLIVPDNWSELSESDKEARLNGVIGALIK